MVSADFLSLDASRATEGHFSIFTQKTEQRRQSIVNIIVVGGLFSIRLGISKACSHLVPSLRFHSVSLQNPKEPTYIESLCTWTKLTARWAQEKTCFSQVNEKDFLKTILKSISFMFVFAAYYLSYSDASAKGCLKLL